MARSDNPGLRPGLPSDNPTFRRKGIQKAPLRWGDFAKKLRLDARGQGLDMVFEPLARVHGALKIYDQSQGCDVRCE